MEQTLSELNDQLYRLGEECAYLRLEVTRLWGVLDRIDRIEPETMAWAEKEMGFQLDKRRFRGKAQALTD